MNTALEDLLIRLEALSAEGVDCSDPSLHETVDVIQVHDLIRQRGELIQQLPRALEASAPVSYREWNRITVIHHQGRRIHENVEHARSRMVVDVTVNCSGRMFLDRITSMLK